MQNQSPMNPLVTPWDLRAHPFVIPNFIPIYCILPSDFLRNPKVSGLTPPPPPQLGLQIEFLPVPWGGQYPPLLISAIPAQLLKSPKGLWLPLRRGQVGGVPFTITHSLGEVSHSSAFCLLRSQPSLGLSFPIGQIGVSDRAKLRPVR